MGRDTSDVFHPLISVIIPTHNRLALLRDALASVRAQKLENLEILVVADGCTDGTVQYLRDLAGEDPRVVPIVRDRGGQAAARNQALVTARAPLVAFLDDDDLWAPEALSGLRDHLEGRPVVAALGWKFRSEAAGLDAAAVLASPSAFDLRPWPPHTVPNPVDATSMALQPPFFISGALFSRTYILAAGGFPEDVEAAEDYGLWLELAAKGPIPWVDVRVVLVREHLGQDTADVGRHSAGCYELLERFRRHHGLPPGLCERQWHDRMAALALSASWGALMRGRAPQARRWALKCLAHRPLRLKACAYLAASLAPSAALRLRRVLRRRPAAPGPRGEP